MSEMGQPDVRERPSDLDWVKHTFLVSEKDLTKFDIYNRLLTDADLKWTDTTIGGHQAINMPYQFTRYADIKTGLAYRGMAEVSTFGQEDESIRFDGGSSGDGSIIGDMVGKIAEDYRDIGEASSGMFGMGRYYQESIEENAQLVHMRFGVPEYNSVIRFLGYFYSPTKGYLANKGSGMAFKAGAAVGSLIGFMLMIPALPFVLGGRAFRRVIDSPSSKFYYLKPTMVLYRQAVSSMLDAISVNLGISPFSPDDIKRGEYDRTNQHGSADYLTIFHELLPDLIEPDGFINWFGVTTRFQRKANRINDILQQEMQSSNPWVGARSLVKKYAQIHRQAMSGQRKATPQKDYLDGWFNISANVFGGSTSSKSPGSSDSSAGGDANDTASQDAAASTNLVNILSSDAENDLYNNDVEGMGDHSDGVENPRDNLNKHLIDINPSAVAGTSDLYSFFRAEMQDGAQFVTFRVENPGSMSESFSNSTKDSELANKLNNISSTARNFKFDYGTILSSLPGISSFVNAVTGVIGGALEQLHIGGLMGLSGMSFVDIPKQWDSSSANLPRADFTIQLRSVYGNKISQFFDIFVPLAMLMAGALPLSTGKQSYTSPFICECYSRSRCTIRLGMIESLSITRAVSNLPFNVNKGITGVDVSFSVVDLSSVMHMPIMAGEPSIAQRLVSGATGLQFGEGAAKATDALMAILSPSTYQEDNPFLDYMATLSSLSITQMIYGTRKIQLDVAHRRQNMKTWRSAPAVIAEIGDTFIGKSIRYMSRPSERG